MTTEELKAQAAPIPVAKPTPKLDQTTLLAFITFIVISGGASIAIRFTYAEIAPFWGGAARFTLAALLLGLLALIRKVQMPRGRALFYAAAFGFFSMGASFTLIYWGLVKTPASLYQVVVSVVPLLTLFFAFFHKLEKLHWRGLLGSVLAVAGIVIALSGTMSAGVEVSIPHLLAIIGGAACLAEAGVIAKKYVRSHPIATNTIAMTVGALVLGTASLITRESWTLPRTSTTWLALVYLIVITVAAFLLYLFVLGRWTASATSYSFVLIPFITVILASWLANERITPVFIAGGAVVLLGVWVGALMPVKSSAG
jgi:drug/metabolite transporter (DMT)-like permease